MSLTRRVARPVCPPEVAHYLTTGCYMAPSDDQIGFEVFQVAGQTIRGNLDGLRALWLAHATEVKRQHPEETFAELALAGDDTEAAGLGRMSCTDHPVTPDTTNNERGLDR